MKLGTIIHQLILIILSDSANVNCSLLYVLRFHVIVNARHTIVCVSAPIFFYFFLFLLISSFLFCLHLLC